MHDYRKHDLTGLKRVYCGKWDTFKLTEDTDVGERVKILEKIILDFSRSVQGKYISIGEQTFAISIPKNALFDSYPKALLATIIENADEVQFCPQDGEIVLLVTIYSVLQFYDGKLI